MERHLRNSVAILAVAAVAACACSVPVFRYALEHWRASNYRAILFHKGPLDSASRALFSTLETKSSRPPRLNARCALVNVADSLGPREQSWWEALKGGKLPQLCLYYPFAQYGDAPAWRGKLTADNVRRLVGSPLRSEISRRLAAGETAVWVLLQSGNAAKDKAASKTLRTVLREMEGSLKLPEVAEEDRHLVSAADKDDTLRIAFSTVVLSRKDPAEEVLVQALVGTEPDLAGTREPIVFPLYGRARALYALVGTGINAEQIRKACSFLVGQCSCTIKAQNPGTDLPCSFDWDSAVKKSRHVQEPLPPLKGFGGFIEKDAK